MVLNLDNVGLSESEGRKWKKVVMRVNMCSDSIPGGVHRNLKHVAIIPWMRANEEHPCPSLMTSQESGNFREGLTRKAIEFGQHLIIKRSDRSYVNRKNFAESVESITIPHVMTVRVDEKIEEEEAVLWMDDCPRPITPS
jgi:hypothetical protein